MNGINNNNALSNYQPHVQHQESSLDVVFKDLEADYPDGDINIALPKAHVHSTAGKLDEALALGIVTSTNVNVNTNTSNDSVGSKQLKPSNNVLDDDVEQLYGDVTVEGEMDVCATKNTQETGGDTINVASKTGLANSKAFNYNRGAPRVASNSYDDLGESTYEDWTQKEVLMWCKQVLLANNFEKQLILSFLKELRTKCATGKTLEQFKNNNESLLAFQSQFSTENQAFALWLAIQTAITDLGSPRL